MSVLDILRWPDQRLTETCDPIAEITPEIEKLAADMLETMYAAEGRGLAGPQVGALRRIFVVDAGWKQGKPDPMVFINPVLQEVSEETSEAEEACLSIPGLAMSVRRPAEVQMQWIGVTGARYVQRFVDFEAVVVQHELDHLDGVVILDHQDVAARDGLIAAYEAQA